MYVHPRSIRCKQTRDTHFSHHNLNLKFNKTCCIGRLWINSPSSLVSEHLSLKHVFCAYMWRRLWNYMSMSLLYMIHDTLIHPLFIRSDAVRRQKWEGQIHISNQYDSWKLKVRSSNRHADCSLNVHSQSWMTPYVCLTLCREEEGKTDIVQI